jgi:uncharacterized protein YndB with AHSA1/START domain
MAQELPTPAGLLEPIRQSVRVRRPIESAFELFTRDIGRWWPVETHNLRGDVVEVVFEGRTGGRIYERARDGVTTDWGQVLAWEPPRRVVFTWEATARRGAATEIEVRFSDVAAGATLVEVEHRGWERMGVPVGAETRSGYLQGWPGVLGLFARRADASDPG